MQLKFDFNNMMQSSIGEQGITEKEIESVLDKAQDSYAYFEKNRGTGWMGWSELPYNQEDIVRDIIYTAAEVRSVLWRCSTRFAISDTTTSTQRKEA